MKIETRVKRISKKEVVMKTYKFEIIIEEGSDEFWESIQNRTGCDEVLEAITICFDNEGWSPKIRLVEYNNHE